MLENPRSVEFSRGTLRFILWFIIGTSVVGATAMALLVQSGHVALGIVVIVAMTAAITCVPILLNRRERLRARSGGETVTRETPSIERPARVRLLAAIGLALVTLAFVLDIVGAPINGVRLIAGLLGAASMLSAGYLMRSKSR